MSFYGLIKAMVIPSAKQAPVSFHVWILDQLAELFRVRVSEHGPSFHLVFTGTNRGHATCWFVSLLSGRARLHPRTLRHVNLLHGNVGTGQ